MGVLMREFGIQGSDDGAAMAKANAGNSRSPVILNSPTSSGALKNAAASSGGISNAISTSSFLNGGAQKLGSTGFGKSLLGQ